MKLKLASVLVCLIFGSLTTAAIAEDDTRTTATDSSATASEPATATEQSGDTATIGTSTSDGTLSASPTETDSK
ncbi:MAG TPA: hypothetical protein VKD04_02395 [Burkholderiales bacterium]|nr:hypothetical protein [Burkholderiales bacterium]